MSAALRDEDWEILRRYIYLLLVIANGKSLPLPRTPPRTLNDIDFFVQGAEFEIRLDKTLELTADALKDASGTLTEAHRAAAAIQVGAPTSELAEQLAKDLHALGALVKADDTATRLSGFFATAAATVNALRR
jgi:hypothetical protein